ncbi:MAG: hypothetical protein L0Z50_14410 [Verrucomicrobiales bacterium]|nr:hypothetical protein [Verrucomicrobiales bacterium]
MKTITTREFFHAPGLVKSLQPGQSLVVTDKGAPAFTVTRAGRRHAKTQADLEREAAEICPDEGPKVNFTSAIKEMKRR